MIMIKDAIRELGYTNWVLYGKPTNEAEFNEMLRVRNDDGIESTDYPDGLTWDAVSAKKTELENAEPLKLLREERNRRLAETDWWVLPDRTPTDEQTAYRQALRDITDTYSSLDTVVWPTKPE